MSAIITADLHAADNERDSYRFKFLTKQLPAIIKKEKPECLLVLGDLTEEKDRFSSTLVNRVVNLFNTLASLTPVIIETGNHDYVAEGHPFFEFMKHIPGITWVNTPTAGKDLPGKLSILQDTIFLPHTHDHERDWDNIDFKKYSIAFAHNTFSNADAGGGRKLSGIPLTYFPRKLTVIAGDIHVPQTIGNLTYVGSPYLVDFGDDFEPRVLRLDHRGLTSIPCPGVQKRLVEIAQPEDIVKLLRKSKLNEGDIVKVRIEPSANESWADVQQSVRKYCEDNHLIVHLVQPTQPVAVRPKQKEEHEKPRSDEDILKAYGKSMGVETHLMKVGLEILRSE